jgi:hypothetical protein
MGNSMKECHAVNTLFFPAIVKVNVPYPFRTGFDEAVGSAFLSGESDAGPDELLQDAISTLQQIKMVSKFFILLLLIKHLMIHSDHRLFRMI